VKVLDKNGVELKVGSRVQSAPAEETVVRPGLHGTVQGADSTIDLRNLCVPVLWDGHPRPCWHRVDLMWRCTDLLAQPNQPEGEPDA
jgi:hypothetical protein